MREFLYIKEAKLQNKINTPWHSRHEAEFCCATIFMYIFKEIQHQICQYRFTVAGFLNFAVQSLLTAQH